MTTSLERTLAADLAECLELDAACRRVFQAAAALRTYNKGSVLAVKRTARNLKLLMDDKLHSLDIENVIDGFGDEAETRTAGSDCNIHDRMSFASFFGAALIVIAIVLLAGAALTSLHPPRYRYAGVCVRSLVGVT